MTAFLVALSLLVQLIATPYHEALAAPALSEADAAAIAADLKATFGDQAALCVQIDDKGAPSPHKPCSHCNDQCALCRLFAGAAAFAPPDAPAVPRRLNPGRRVAGPAPGFGAFSVFSGQPNRARAPPLAV